jgi:acetyltransferase-like isoleucine patch superfamily enzyme
MSDSYNRYNKAVTGDYFQNGNGFVASTATVDPTSVAAKEIFIGGAAQVLDNAVIQGRVRIEGAAIIRGNAQIIGPRTPSAKTSLAYSPVIIIKDHAIIEGDAIVTADISHYTSYPFGLSNFAYPAGIVIGGYSVVGDDAIIGAGTTLIDNVRIHNEAVVAETSLEGYESEPYNPIDP